MAVCRYARGALLIAATSICAAGMSCHAEADMRTSTSYRSYHLPGTTPASLISHMRHSPFLGSAGAAIAHITPDYVLDVATQPAGGACRIQRMSLDMNFVITLPQADESAMSSSTRSLWRRFVAFAKHHEETHRSIYLDCASRFLAKARAIVPSGNCPEVKARLQRLLAEESRACDRRQQAFDLREVTHVLHTALFRAAGVQPVPQQVASEGGSIDTGYGLPTR